MMPRRLRLGRAIGFILWVIGSGSAVHAQGVEIAPLAGYRFGNDFFELVTGRPVDDDGAPAVGVVVDVPVGGGLQVEAQYTHQRATVSTPAGPFGPAARWRVTVDHWQGGGLQEYFGGRVRPFAVGALGLTRYAGAGDSEIRFTVSAGGGVKLFPSSRVGVRFNSQVFATLAYADATVVSYAPGLALVGLNADIVWQIEFTAALVFRLS